VGFAVGPSGNAPTEAHTVIRYAPGSEMAADLLARHLTAPVTEQADPTLDANHLTLVTGTDFTTVMQTPRPAPTTATTAPASTTSTTVIGITPGQAPPGVNC